MWHVVRSPVFVGKQRTPEATRIADVAGVLIDHLARVRRLRSSYHVSMLAVFNGDANAVAVCACQPRLLQVTFGSLAPSGSLSAVPA